MKVTVRFTPYLSVLTKRQKIEVDLNENAHLNDLLEILSTRYGKGLRDRMYTSEMDSVDAWALVIADGKAIPLPLVPESNVKLKEGSVVVLMTPVGGG